jgi:hypothetical protein
MRLPSVWLWAGCWLPVACVAEGAATPCTSHEVRLPLAEEVWVISETANVSVAIEASADPVKSKTLRGEVLALLRQLVAEQDQAKWQITSANLWRDPSGLERWQLKAEIRAAQSLLPGLAARAEKLSKPGLVLSVTIDWTPSLQEVEEAKAKARTVLYRRALEEAERLNQALGEKRHYRVGDVELRPPGTSLPVVAKAREVVVSEETLPRADRLVLEAWVVLKERECEVTGLSSGNPN